MSKLRPTRDRSRLHRALLVPAYGSVIVALWLWIAIADAPPIPFSLSWILLGPMFGAYHWVAIKAARPWGTDKFRVLTLFGTLFPLWGLLPIFVTLFSGWPELIGLSGIPLLIAVARAYGFRVASIPIALAVSAAPVALCGNFDEGDFKTGAGEHLNTATAAALSWHIGAILLCTACVIRYRLRPPPNPTPLRCIQCAYSLRGIKTDVCPECGTRQQRG